MRPDGLRPRDRKAKYATQTTPKRSRNVASNAQIAISRSDLSYSPASLARKLDEMRDNLISNAAQSERIRIELVGLENMDNTSEEYQKKREDILKMIDNPDFDAFGKTQLNFADAAIAGAKLLVDETVATRSMSKKLSTTCGVDEAAILYKPLPMDCSQYKAITNLQTDRIASMCESLFDFHKQIQFKSTILNHIDPDKKGMSKSDVRFTRKTKKEQLEEAIRENRKRPLRENNQKNGRGKGTDGADPTTLRTPSTKKEFNPLDDKRIIEAYALEVASEVRDTKKRRKIAPIPFNINLLDEESVEMEDLSDSASSSSNNFPAHAQAHATHTTRI